jgi:protein O-GlcNAc transferase
MISAAGERDLKRAADLHVKGDLVAAERGYIAVLRRQPRQWRARYLLGMLLAQRGELEPARAELERSIGANPSAAEPRMALADVLARLGLAAEACVQYTKVIHLDPHHSAAHFMLGHAAEVAGRWEDAALRYQAAVRAAPTLAEAWNNLGNVYRALGRFDEALDAYRRATEAKPDWPDPHHNLGVLYEVELERWNEALVCYQNAVDLDPDAPMARFHLGAMLTRLRSYEKALVHYERALQLKPDFAEVYNNLGLIFLQQSFLAEARVCYERAIAADPALAEAHNNLGCLLNVIEQFPLAEHYFGLALRHRPAFPEACNGLGLALIEQGRLDQAGKALQAALSLRPEFQEALVNQGRMHQMLDRPHLARAAFLSASALQRNDGLVVRAHSMVPQVMGTRSEIEWSRAELEAGLDELLTRRLACSEEELLKYLDTPFYLAYHGQNDRGLLEKLAAVYAQTCPELLAIAPHCAGYRRASAARVRIGFVSRFFGNHSVGRFFNPIIEQLARLDDFEVTVFSICAREDEVFERLVNSCHAHVPLPYQLQPARALIADQALDILVYTDVGMDAFSYLLAFARLAPVQCLLHGHSVTSGLPGLDYFISSRLLEPEDAQDQFSEKLVLLDSLMMYLEPWGRPEAPVSRASLGWSPDERVYLCPMKLQKLHPDMDRAFGEILRRDPAACVVLYEDNRRRDWGERLRARFGRTLGEDAGRVRFLPWASLPELMSAMLAADAVLDSFHHGGGTTANICLSLGVPMITWPGPTSRGRGLLAYYGLLGVADFVAPTQEQFVELALRAAQDPDWRARGGRQILAELPRLHAHDRVFTQYAQALRILAREYPGPFVRAYPGGRRYFETYSVTASPQGMGVLFAARPGAQAVTVAPRYTDDDEAPPLIEARLPDRFGVRIADAEVLGGSPLALRGREALFDVSAHPGFERLDYHADAVQYIDKVVAVIHSAQGAGPELAAGILLTGRGSANYFHWLVEHLPRLSLVDDLARQVLLVDEAVTRSPQLRDALHACFGAAQPRVVALSPGVRYRVAELTYLSACSWIPTEYRSGEPIRARDQALDSSSVRWVRDRLAALIPGLPARNERRIYISRQQARGVRHMLNEHEAEAAFVAAGFEVIQPGTLSLADQAGLFASAGMVAGASGAAMTNLLFCRPGTRVLCLMPKAWREFALFSSMADILGHEMRFVDGEVQPGTHSVVYQCDYTIDIRALRAQLQAWR